jgi:hypothetical protein
MRYILSDLGLPTTPRRCRAVGIPSEVLQKGARDIDVRLDRVGCIRGLALSSWHQDGEKQHGHNSRSGDRYTPDPLPFMEFIHVTFAPATVATGIVNRSLHDQVNSALILFNRTVPQRSNDFSWCPHPVA